LFHQFLFSEGLSFAQRLLLHATTQIGLNYDVLDVGEVILGRCDLLHGFVKVVDLGVVGLHYFVVLVNCSFDFCSDFLYVVDGLFYFLRYLFVHRKQLLLVKLPLRRAHL